MSGTHLQLDPFTFLADIEKLIRQFFSRIPEHAQALPLEVNVNRETTTAPHKSAGRDMFSRFGS